MFSLLESIKIYLNLEKCVFVLGINRHELERNIASVLPEPIEPHQRQIRAHEYIEKLCGNIVRLPYPSPKAQPLLVKKWLGALDDICREELLRLIKDHAFLPLNPRRIKMWCNTVMQLHDHRVMETRAAPPVEEMPALALAAALHTFYPALHQGLATSSSFISALKRWCDAELRFEPELEVFAGIARVFIRPPFITTLSRHEKEAVEDVAKATEAKERDINKFEAARADRLRVLEPILKRAYGWSGEITGAKDSNAEAPRKSEHPPFNRSFLPELLPPAATRRRGVHHGISNQALPSPRLRRCLFTAWLRKNPVRPRQQPQLPPAQWRS